MTEKQIMETMDDLIRLADKLREQAEADGELGARAYFDGKSDAFAFMEIKISEAKERLETKVGEA